MSSSKKTKELVQLSLMAAIVVVVAFVPFLGFIPLVVIKATTVHIPVIVGAILLGPKAGGVLGGIFGLTSIIKNTMEPSLVSFVFTPFVPVPGQSSGDLRALFIALAPRILVGVVAGLVYQALSKSDPKKRMACAVAAFAGSMTNTCLVMGSIYFMFGQEYAAAQQIACEAHAKALMVVVATYGVAEAFVAVVFSVVIAPPLMKLIRT